MKAFTRFISLLVIVVMASALFAIIGAIDNLYASYKSRRDEVVLYYQAGMSLKCI